MKRLLVISSWFLVAVSLVTCHLSLVTFSYAQTASSSGSLIQKLDELKKEIASKAAEIKNEVNKKVQNKAVIGKIVKIDEGKMIIQSINSEKTINFDEFTEVIGLNNKKIKITTLEEGDDVASLGDFDDKNNLAAKRIIFLENYATSSGELIWGRIQKSQGQTINLKNKSGEAERIITDSQTVFALGSSEASISDAKAEKFMVARGRRLKDKSLSARFVYFIPSVGFAKPSVKTSPQPAKREN